MARAEREKTRSRTHLAYRFEDGFRVHLHRVTRDRTKISLHVEHRPMVLGYPPGHEYWP